MRKAVLLLCTLALLISAPAAHAQEGRRDPFEPLVDEDAGAVVVVPGGAETDAGTGGTGSDGAGTGGDSEGTPNTGMETADWTGLAYLLIVMGTAALILARLRRPITNLAPRRR